MSFWIRLSYYLLGISLGTIILIFIFKEKQVSFCYFPNCRVLKEIRSCEVVFPSDSISVQTKQMVQFLLQNGDVDFSESQVHTQPCKTYVIKGDYSGEHHLIKVNLCQDLKKADIQAIE